LDASDRGTIADISGDVSQWNDKSSNDNDAIQLTGTLQPVTNQNTIGGQNSITYDGVDDVLVIPADSTIDNLFDGGGSFFAVANPLSGGIINQGRLFDKNIERNAFCLIHKLLIRNLL